MNPDQLASAYLSGAGKWTGCDWPTSLEPLGLDVRGLSARQAVFLVNATSGREQEAWRNAWRWLTRVEWDARQAEDLAAQAFHEALHGHFEQALAFLLVARRLESRYPKNQVWDELYRVVAEASASTPLLV